MRKLAAYYFSGTGNTRYVTDELCGYLAGEFAVQVYDISDDGVRVDDGSDMLLFAFPIYGSAPPVPMRRFIHANAAAIKGKEVIVIATQFMFSGDGAASLGRTITKLGGRVNYAEHIDMPNNLADFPLLKIRNGAALEKILKKADKRIKGLACNVKEGYRFRRGFDPLSHAVGYFLQRKWWLKGEKSKKNKLRIDAENCVGCGACVGKCPVHNLVIERGKAKPRGNCAFCYRCVNLCPKQAIALFGKNTPAVQYKGPILVSEKTGKAVPQTITAE